MEDKEAAILGLMGLGGAKGILTDGLKGLYEKLPERLKNRIEGGAELTPTEKFTEANIIQKELKIPMRQTINSLDALNEYYRETNPVSGNNKTLDSL